jgi:FkbM family methyltransferase
VSAIFEPGCEAGLKEAFFAHACSRYFVEGGANHPHHLSQTWHLEQRGRDGVLIEPQPELAVALRRQRPAKVYPVACASPQQAGRTMSLHLAGIHSSLDPYLNISTIRPKGTIEVAVTTLDEILLDAGAPAPIDLLSVDVEGLEIDVLKGFDLKRWRPRLIRIEDLAMNLDLHRYLRLRGDKWMRRTGLNRWYVPHDTPVSVALKRRLQSASIILACHCGICARRPAACVTAPGCLAARPVRYLRDWRLRCG